jgi:hypothetical protein
MKTNTNVAPATPESVWAILQDLAVKQVERERLHLENEQILKEKFAETDRQMKETDRRIEETDRQMKETDRRIDKVCATMGSWAYNHGRFAEEYFFNSFEQGKRNFFGERFDSVMKNKGGIKIDDEYDLLLINGEAIGIVEVKFKANENDLPKVLKKAETFRINFPDYANHKVYLGLASMAFYPELEEACEKEGIAIIKQVGDTVVVNDGYVKVF